MSAKKLSVDMLQSVSGGWNESQLNQEEAAEFHSIRNRLDEIKDTQQGSQSEIDSLLESLYAFERRMEDKYGK